MIRYAFSGDETVPQGATPTALDDGDFWGGAALCGVAIAIAAAVAPLRPAFAADDDFVAPAAPTAVVDEDYQPVSVSPPSPWLRLYLPDPEELPAGALFGVPEEDAWRAPLFAQGPPSRPAFADDSDFVATVATALAPDEDFWAPPVPAQPPWRRLYLPDGDDLVVTAAPQTLGVDEDAWLPPRAVAAPSPRLYLPDPDELAVTATVATTVDEDAWVPPVPRPTSWTAQLFGDPADLASPAPTLAAEDDAWQPRAAPPAPFPRLYLPDAEAAPAGFLRGQPDEDFWRNHVAPVTATLYQRLPYAVSLWDPEEIPGLPQPAAVAPQIFLRGVQDAYAIEGAVDAYTLRGTQDLYTVTGAQDSYSLVGRVEDPEDNILPFPATFSVPLGDDVAIGLTILQASGAALDLTGGQLVFGLKKLLSDTTILLTKSSPASGIVIGSPATAGLATLTLNAADTAALGDGPYAFDVQFISASAKKSTVITGTLILIQHPTR
jgi:hypothetical protein